MNAKQYLKQAYRLNELIECNKQEIDDLYELSISIAGTDCSKDRVQTSPQNAAAFVKIVEKIVDLENVINDEIEQMLNLKLEIRTVINEVQDNNEKLLLKYRYLNFMQWDEVCEKMNIAMRTSQRIHAEALKHVKVPA